MASWWLAGALLAFPLLLPGPLLQAQTARNFVRAAVNRPIRAKASCAWQPPTMA